jgi:hypothetical protein
MPHTGYFLVSYELGSTKENLQVSIELQFSSYTKMMDWIDFKPKKLVERLTSLIATKDMTITKLELLPHFHANKYFIE